MVAAQIAQSSVFSIGANPGQGFLWGCAASGTPYYCYMKGTPMSKTEKEKALDDAVKSIEKRFGEGAIAYLGRASNMVVETIPTGSLALDAALGSGVPRGRVIEIYGPESSGKTTLCL